jgi:pimeloyl-ACP methyl ester carboxylesterase
MAIGAIVATEPFEHAQIEANGIVVHTFSVGQGPLVVFCHGFPESWYSWRHQLPAVAEAGFRAMALDMRGYGGTGALPAQVPGLRGLKVFPGAGHWLQQERAREVNLQLIGFLTSL